MNEIDRVVTHLVSSCCMYASVWDWNVTKMTIGNCEIVAQEVQTWEAGALFMLVCITACCSLFKLPTWSPEVILCQSRFINFINIQSVTWPLCWWSTILRFSNDSPSQSRLWALSPLRLPSPFLLTMKLEAVVSPDWKRGWSWVVIDRELIGMNVDWRSWIPKKRNVIGLSWWRCQHRMKARPINKGNFCPLSASMIVQVSRI